MVIVVVVAATRFSDRSMAVMAVVSVVAGARSVLRPTSGKEGG